MVTIPFDNSYARLPERFFERRRPSPVAAPRLIRANGPLASRLGIDPDWLASDEGVAMVAGNVVPDNAEPLAMAYAGHQFGTFVPQLGDGRAILLGEVVDGSGARRDIHLKGAGRTRFSRGGDGRAALGPVLREYAVSEAMHALGIRTTRALAAVTTGESVWREEKLPGAVFARVASSHIRVGTFQYFASRGDEDGVRLLAEHVLARHYSDLASAPRPFLALLEAVVDAQAQLVADWLLVGFIHGVMNTDNMSIAGETIDYGPCAFMDEYDPGRVFSSIDRNGRYAFGNQPAIAGWNLTRFAECILPLIASDVDVAVHDAQKVLDAYQDVFNGHYAAGVRRKLGLTTRRDDDVLLAQELLAAMAAGSADFTLTFRRLCDAAEDEQNDARLESLFHDPSRVREWLARWRSRLQQESLAPLDRANAMRAVNPAFIPRNHRVEAVIRAAVDADDLRPFEEFLAVLANPFDDQPQHEQYMRPPEQNERVLETFCGT